jgi:hypothetical protein
MSTSFQHLCDLVREINSGSAGAVPAQFEFDVGELAAVIDSTSVAASVLLLGTGSESEGQEIIRSAQSWVRQTALPPPSRREDWSAQDGLRMLARICRVSGIDPILPDWGGSE